MKTAWIGVGLALLAVACGKDETTNNGTNCGVGTRCATDFGHTGADATHDPDSNTVPTPDMGGTPDAGEVDVPDATKPGGCDRMPRPADGPRKVVVSLPFTNSTYEIFDLDAAGELSRPGVTFEMGAAHEGEIVFTPDGQVGFAVQENGTLGVFRLNSAGMPEVLAAQHQAGFYVSGAIIDDAGENLYAWETGFRKTDDLSAKGALYRVPIGCATGLPEAPIEFFRGKLIRGVSRISPTRLAVAAVDVIDDETPMDAHLVDFAGPSRLASVSTFPDEDSITAGFATTHDGLYMLIGDNSAFAEAPNSVAVIGIQGSQLFAQQSFDILDPARILTSPFDNAALVLSTVGDAIWVLDYNPGAAASPFSIRGELETTAPILLPLGAAMVTRGSLEGLTIIGENVGIRRVQFETDGAVTDLGLFELGSGIESIPGAVGVQP